MRIELTPTTRTCGECTLCCKVMEVRSIEKPKDQWCAHAKRGRGCTVYEDRPDECRTFRCMWLEGLAPEWARPDKIHGVLVPTEKDEGFVVHEDPGYPRFASDALKMVIDHFIADGKRYVVIVCGVGRTIVARHNKMKEVVERVKEAFAELK